MDRAAADVLCQGLSGGIVDEEGQESPSIGLGKSSFVVRNPADMPQIAEYMPIMR